MEDSLQKLVYSTSDTALAAWLFSSGFELLEVDGSKFPVVFHFENSSQELYKLVRAFQVGKAEGNIAAFYRAYKIMLSKVKTARL